MRHDRTPVPRLYPLEQTNAYRAGREAGREEFNGASFTVGLVAGVLVTLLGLAGFFLLR